MGPRCGHTFRSRQRRHPGGSAEHVDDAEYLRAAMAAGAAGYLVKRAADTERMSAIRAVHAGRTFVDFTQAGVPSPMASAQQAGQTQPPKSLSRREREVLRLLAQGH